MRIGLVLLAVIAVLAAVITGAVLLRGANADANERDHPDQVWLLQRRAGQIWQFQQGKLTPLEGAVASVRGRDWTIGVSQAELKTLLDDKSLSLPEGAQVRSFRGSELAEIVIQNALFLVAVREVPEGPMGFLPSSAINKVAPQADAEVLMLPPGDPDPAATLNIDFAPQALDWELSKGLDVERFSFRIPYPEGWVYQAELGNISIAPDEATLALETDGDLATVPQEPTITLNAIPLQSFNLDATIPFEQMRDTLIQLGGFNTAETFELPVMGRRSTTLVGSGQDGRYGLASLWLQNGYLILFTLNTVDPQQLDDLAYGWGLLLAGVTPVNPGELSSTKLGNVALPYPADWEIQVMDAGNVRVGDAASQQSIAASLSPRSDLSSEASPSLESLGQVLLSNFHVVGLVDRSEYVINGQSALSWVAQTEEGSWIRLLLTLQADRVLLLVHSSANAELIAAFDPTWTAILQGITYEPA